MIGLAIVLTVFTIAYLCRDRLRARNSREIHDRTWRRQVAVHRQIRRIARRRQ